jgi:hypothetical protein
MKSDRFYLVCLRDTVGSNTSFHVEKGGGYSTDVGRARVINREEAQRFWNGAREIDLPVCADRVDAETVIHVDCQNLPIKSQIEEHCGDYVAFHHRMWDGNDVYWLTENGDLSTDFTQAAHFSKPVNKESFISVPFSLADSVKRRTFPIAKLNQRKLVQAAGLIIPDHIKRYRRRRGSDKHRFHCPGCGRIHWQTNPHDFDGCRNVDCKFWSPSMH